MEIDIQQDELAIIEKMFSVQNIFHRQHENYSESSSVPTQSFIRLTENIMLIQLSNDD